MIVKPIFECKEETWRLYVKDHQGLEVQRIPGIGESISLGHGASYKVTNVTTDLYQDDVWLDFEPLSTEEFIFIFCDQHDMQEAVNRKWEFDPGRNKDTEEKFFEALEAYDEKVDEELGD